MEKDGEILYNSKYTKHVKINSHYQKKKFYILILILFVNIGSIIFDFINRKESNNLLNLLNYKLLEYKEYNEIINEKYIHEQKFFCEHQDIFYNQKFEDIIRLTNINFNKLNYKMFVEFSLFNSPINDRKTTFGFRESSISKRILLCWSKIKFSLTFCR